MLLPIDDGQVSDAEVNPTGKENEGMEVMIAPL
jgi:Holliday junction resolvase RusA-like endonuclease